MPSAQPIRPSTTMVPSPSPPPPIGIPKPPPPPPPCSPRRSSILLLCSRSSQRIDSLRRLNPAILAGLRQAVHVGMHLQFGNPLGASCGNLMKAAVPQALPSSAQSRTRARAVKPFFTLRRDYPFVGCRSRVADCVARVRVLSHGCTASRGAQSGAPLHFRVRDAEDPRRRLRRRAVQA